MNKINSLHERDVSFPDLKKKVKKSLLQRLLLFNFLVVSICSMWSQTAPSISYESPQNYLWNAAITTLAPVNSGGSVPALNYKQVSTLAGTTSGFLDGTGTTAKMDGPLGMTMDASGNVYFVDSANFRIRKMTPEGVVTTIAGDGYSFLFYGRLKNNATGSSASFSWPSGIVLDTANNCLYVADKENDVIRKVSLTGTFVVTTFAGSGTSSSLDGKGTAATFKKPNGIAIDPTNTYLYVTDRTGNKIRRITISDAQVLTIAGSGTASTVDNATGTSATFNEPTGIAVDANFIYVSDFGGNKIRKIALTTPYAVTILAGSGAASSLDNTGTAATFKSPFGITLDGAGNLFVAEWGNKIRQITPTGIVTTIAGSGASTSVDGNGIAATFNEPANIVIHPTTGIGYVSEWTGDRIRKIELGGYTLSPSLPKGLTFDVLTGSISGTPTDINYGPLNYTITAYNYYGSSTTTVAITTANVPTLTTTVASALTHITTTTGGNVTANGGSTLLEKGICWSTSANPTILDTKVVDGSTNTGSFTAAITGLSPTTTYYVRAYATNSVGTAYGTQVSFTTLMTPPTISYTASSTFVVNTPITALETTNIGGFAKGIVSVSNLAGECNQKGMIDGQGSAARFSGPMGTATDANGNVYVADKNNNAIRKITADGLVSTYATIIAPIGVATDAEGNVYAISKDSNNKIVKFDSLGNSTIYNNSILGPNAIAIDSVGNMYILDGGLLKKVTPAGVVTIVANFNFPNAIAIAANGDIFVDEEDRIKKITTTGVVSTFLLTNYYITSMMIDANGMLYVTDRSDASIKKITPQGIVTTITGHQGNDCDNGTLAVANFNNPSGLSMDSTGNLYVSDYNTNLIRKITLSGFSVNPALPAGLVLNADGSITGTPTVATAATNYTLTAANTGGSSTYTINLTIATVPSLTTTVATSITSTTITLGGTITSDGYASVTARGVCWSTSPNPSTADSTTTDGTGTGLFESAIMGLTPFTTYYIRAYATNTVGSVYGTQVSYTTLAPIPVIQYTAANTYTVNTAIAPLTVTNTGGAVANSLAGVSTIAGSTSGFTNGTTDAKFNQPSDVVKDSNGNLFVTDVFNNAIRKITPSGTVTTFAGGSPGSIDGLGTDAKFFSPYNIEIDTNDNLYVSDTGNHMIRKITPDGLVSTLAGSISWGNTDGTGTSAQFKLPKGLTLDSLGNVYVADYGNNKIRKITPSGIVTTYFSGLSVPTDIAFNSAGSLFVRQESLGINSLVKLSFPTGLPQIVTYSNITYNVKAFTFDNNDNIYIATAGVISKSIEPFDNANTKYVAGTFDQGFTDGSFQDAQFKIPNALTIDNEGMMYVADINNNRIRKISLYGYSVSPALPTGLTLNENGSITGTPTLATAAANYTIMGTNSGGSSSKTLNFAITTIPTITTTEASAITATTASLGGTVTSDGYASVTARGLCWSTSTNPTTANSVTTDGIGTGIFVSAISGLSPVTKYYIRAYATNNVGTVYGNEFSFTTVLPLPVIQYSAAVTYAVNTEITPLTVTNTGGVVINSLAGVSTFAGSDAGYTEGTTNAQFSQPSGVVTDSNGNLFVADSSNNAIRKITPSGTVSTFAGGTSGTADGLGTAAQFFRPNSIAIDANDNLYISDTGNHLIRKITPSGLVSTLAGTAGTAGFVDGAGTSAQFNRPYGLTLDVSGNVYVADYANHSIRKITPAGVVSIYFNMDSYSRTLENPTAVAFDSAGNLFVSQASSNGLVKILVTDSYSELTNFDNNSPIGTITFDTNKSIYAASGGYIVKAHEPYTSGILFAGSGQGFADGALLEAKFGGIRGLTIDNEGVMYVADGVNNRIRKISPFGYSISPALPSGLVLNANGSITGTPSEASPATDYVVTATNSGGNSSYLMSITINSAFQPPIASAQTFSGGHTVADLVAIGTALKWYADATGGTALVTTTPLVSGTYYVSQTIDAIESTRTSVEVTVKPLAPTAAPQTFCSGTIADLVATGTNLKWYDVATNGTALATSTALASGTYYVSQTNNSEESARTSVDVTVNNSVAGTVSVGQLIVRGTQPAAISLTGNIGLVQWQSSLDKIKFTTIAGATSSMLTGDQMGILTRRRFYRAIIKSGDCSSVTSEIVEVWTTLATQIQDSQCGKTLASLTTNISANAVPGADYYRFKVVVGNTDPKTIVTRSKSFNLKSLEEGALLNTTYTISVATQSIGLWSDYGTECTITTPSGLTKVQNSQCGTTLASLSTNVTADAVAGVTNYSFKVVQGETTRYLETTARSFNLKSLDSGVFYNTAYSISVATKYNGNWSNYGTECTVTTPSGLTKIKDSQCGTTLASLSTKVVANAVAGVSNYSFKVVNGGTTRTIETVAGAFSLKSLQGGALNGTTYTVSVATKYNGSWGEYGTECTVTTPSIIVPSVSRQAATASVKENVLETVSVLAYPNPFTTTFKLDFQSSSEANVAVFVYDMLGKLLENLNSSSSEINNLELGRNYPSGVYNVIVTQGSEVKTVRVIKE